MKPTAPLSSATKQWRKPALSVGADQPHIAALPRRVQQLLQSGAETGQLLAALIRGCDPAAGPCLQRVRVAWQAARLLQMPYDALSRMGSDAVLSALLAVSRGQAVTDEHRRNAQSQQSASPAAGGVAGEAGPSAAAQGTPVAGGNGNGATSASVAGASPRAGAGIGGEAATGEGSARADSAWRQIQRQRLAVAAEYIEHFSLLPEATLARAGRGGCGRGQGCR